MRVTESSEQPGHTPKRVFFVVGEASGDQLGASLAAELRQRHGDSILFEGLGADGLIAHGLEPIFDIEDIAVMGLAPVVARLPTILRRLTQTVDAIVSTKPDLVVLIDSPDFTHRVAARVRKAAPDIPIIGWVSPSVWAWRPGRAAKMRAFIDHLMVLLPFEVDAHKRLGGPPATYVGHPLINELDSLRPQSPGERPAIGTAPPTVLLLPGSRSGEIKRHMPAMRQTVELLETRFVAEGLPSARYMMPSVPKHADTLRTQVSSWPVTVEVFATKDERRAAMRQAHAAIAASGTVALELALAGVPMLVIYRLDTLAHIFRSLVKVWTIVLPNLVLDRPVVREYVDESVRPQALSRALYAFATDTPERQAQVMAFQELDALMVGPDDQSPAQRARTVVETYLSSNKEKPAQ